MGKLSHFICFITLFISFTAFSNNEDVKDRGRWLQSELNLSWEQKKKIKNILDEYQPQIIELRKRAEEARTEVRKSFRTAKKGKSISKTLMDKFENSRELRNSYQRRRFMMALEIREVLNENQITKLNSLKDFKPTK